MTVKLDVGGLIKKYDTQIEEEEMGVHNVRCRRYWTACGLKGERNDCEHIDCAIYASDHRKESSVENPFLNIGIESFLLAVSIAPWTKNPALAVVLCIAAVIAWNTWGNKMVNIKPLGEPPLVYAGWLFSGFVGLGGVWLWWRFREYIHRRENVARSELLEFKSKGTVNGVQAKQIFDC